MQAVSFRASATDVARGCAVQMGLHSSIAVSAYERWASVFMFRASLSER